MSQTTKPSFCPGPGQTLEWSGSELQERASRSSGSRPTDWAATRAGPSRGPDAALPRLVRPGDPELAAPVDDGLRLRRVRHGAGRHDGGLDPDLQERHAPEGSRNLVRFRWSRSRPGCTRPERSASNGPCAWCATAPRRWSSTSTGRDELTLRVRPLLAFRRSHRLQHESGDWSAETQARGETSSVRPLPYLPRLYLRAVFGETRLDPQWYRHFRYPEETARGYDAEEDLWSPLEWTWSLRPDSRAFLLFSLHENAGDPDPFLDEERRRRRKFAHTRDPVFDELASRAECFLVENDHRDASILAGFPWLADWGRQAMVAAPGSRWRGTGGTRGAGAQPAAAPTADPEPFLARRARPSSTPPTPRSGSSSRSSGWGACAAPQANRRRCSAPRARSSPRTGAARDGTSASGRTGCSSPTLPDGRSPGWTPSSTARR